MAVYIFLYLFIMMTGIVCYGKGIITKKRATVTFCWITGISLVLVEGLRSISVGVDTIAYVEWFRDYCDIKKITSLYHPWRDVEIGFSIINIIVSRITNNEHIFLAIVSVLLITLHMIFIRHNSPDPVMSIALFFGLNFFFTSMVSLRQIIAIGIISWLYPFLLRKKYFQSFLIIVISFCFHDTSILFAAVLIMIYLLPKNRFSGWIYFLGGTASLFVIELLFKLVLKILPAYTLYYDAGFIHSSYNLNIGEMDYFFILLGIGLLTILFINKKFHQRKFYILESILAFSIVFIIYGLKISEMFRMTYYPRYFYIILIPEIIRCYNKENKKILIFFVHIVCILFFLYFLTHNPGDTIPYVSMFSEQ